MENGDIFAKIKFLSKSNFCHLVEYPHLKLASALSDINWYVPSNFLKIHIIIGHTRNFLFNVNWCFGQRVTNVENIGFWAGQHISRTKCFVLRQWIHLHLSETESNGQRCWSRSNSSQMLVFFKETYSW